MTTKDSSTYWKRARVELRAAGFDPDRAAQTSAVVTIASAWTNAHRCNNRVRTIAVPDPASVDTVAVAKELPYGTVTVTAVKGGLEIPAESGNDPILIANAAVIVSFDDGKTG